jgi:prepilin-type N-terminal cleavage/methylation domain-containing protein
VGQAVRGARRRGARAYTLMEVLISISILSVIMAGSTSAIVMALGGIDGSAGNAVRARAAGETLDLVTADLQVATGFTERTATSVTVTVPDRNGDGQPETIRYAWSGQAGAPLTRSVNGGAAESLADNVTYFNVDCLVQAFGPVESAEMVLTSFDSSAGGTQKDYEINNTTWCAEYFKPTLPINVVSWKITRVKFVAKQNAPSTETLSVEIRAADANSLPSASSLETVAVPETALPTSYGWVEVPFMNVANLNPKTAFCLVLRNAASSGKPACLQYQDGGTLSANAGWDITSNGGSAWVGPNNYAEMRFYVYGTVSTLGPPLWP